MYALHCLENIYDIILSSVSQVTREILRVYLGVKTCDIFSLFSTFVVLHDLALFCFSTFCFLCFTSLVILAGFYTEVEPILPPSSNQGRDHEITCQPIKLVNLVPRDTGNFKKYIAICDLDEKQSRLKP